MTKPTLSAVPDFPHWDASVAGLLESTTTHRVDYAIYHTEDAKICLRKTVSVRDRELKIAWTGDVMVQAKDDAVDLTTQLVQALADL
jgi:hypothetical protein